MADTDSRGAIAALKKALLTEKTAWSQAAEVALERELKQACELASQRCRAHLALLEAEEREGG